ncbi:MAG: ABC transporter substrate-binding protein [Spirochaetota bacterium]|nr:ABC transporter substrate-binding protein [Spirochaetota bacterium]
MVNFYFIKRHACLLICFMGCLIFSFLFTKITLSKDIRGVTDKEIKIGLIADMTGPIASVTAILGQASRNYGQYMNNQGGINGRKITTIVEDDHYSIPIGIAAFKKLVFRDGIFALMGPYHTASIKALYGQMDKYKIPNLAFLPQPSVAYPVKTYMFTTGEFYDDDFGVIFYYILKMKKAKNTKFAFVTFDGESGKQVRKSVLNWAKHFNYKQSIHMGIIPLGAMEASSQVMTMKRKGVTHILLHHSVSAGALLLRELRKFGLKTPVFASLLSCSEDTVKLAGESSKSYIGSHAMSSWYDDTPGMKKLRKITLKLQPGTEKPWRSKYYTAGWLTSLLLCEAIKRAGKNLTPESCIKGLESLRNFDTGGISGPVTFSPTKHKGLSTVKLFKADPSSGKLVPITDWTNPPKKKAKRK